MEKIFKSKVAFIAFVILFTSFLFFIYKDPITRIAWAASVGVLVGFVFAQWYWKEKMAKIQDLIDARMASPETAELLKRKEDELFEAANRNTKLVDIIGELQNKIYLLKESDKNKSDEIDSLKVEKMNLKEALKRETRVPNNPTTTKGKGE